MIMEEHKEDNKQSGSLLSGQEPHQKEDMDQATRASLAASSLEVEKGLSPEPDQYNQGEPSENIRGAHSDVESGAERAAVTTEMDGTAENPDLDAGEFDVTTEDLKSLESMEDVADEDNPDL
jgi:hypothetical protein